MSQTFEKVAFYNNHLTKKNLAPHFDKRRLISCKRQDWSIFNVFGKALSTQKSVVIIKQSLYNQLETIANNF